MNGIADRQLFAADALKVFWLDVFSIAVSEYDAVAIGYRAVFLDPREPVQGLIVVQRVSGVGDFLFKVAVVVSD